MLMKKYVKIIILVITVILIAGCGNSKQVIKTCKLSKNDITNGYKLESEYKIYSKSNIVKKVETIEIITSEDDEIIDFFKAYLDENYKTLDKTYGGYTNNITSEKGKIITKTTIDYNEMNLKKYVEDNTAMEKYVNSDNKISLDGIINIYEDMGAICE